MADRSAASSGAHATGKDELTLERHDHTGVIVIDHPSANTWSRQGLDSFHELIGRCADDPTIRSLIVTGRGDRFFCAGDDLNAFVGADRESALDDARRLGRALERLAAFRGVTIAAINGYCLGGGLECALACDIRIAEAHAVLGLPEAGVGLLPCGGGTQRLPWLVGEGWANRIILCGEKVRAETAARIGLVEEVVPQGTAVAAALKLAAGAARQAPSAVSACKRLISAAREHALAEYLPRERDAFAELFKGPEPAEGVRAFLEKRAPKWPPR